MNRLLILLLLFFSFFSFFSCQEKSFDYKIIQYEGTDSLNTKIVKKVNFNSDSLIIYEEYRGYKSDNANSTSDVNITNFYNDTLLVKTLKYYPRTPLRSDSTRMEFYYNDKNLLTKRIVYKYERVLKKGLNFKDNLDADDFEKEHQWLLSSETFYSYDSLGRKTEYNAPEKHWSSQNRYTWKYNQQNQITEYNSLNDDRIIWSKKYEYGQNQYKCVSTWYDYEGNPRHLKEGAGIYRSQTIFNYKLNTRGQEIKQTITNEKGEFESEITTEYDNQNRILKTIKYLEPNKPIMTHIYVYE